jgi:uncharacterized protein YdeI (YjbR/CyaY-like superfamily)
MAAKDKRIDAYIARSADFAKPILVHIRQVVRQACPDVEETMKWSMPTFMYHGILCGMAAFKQHCTFGFWKGTLVVDRKGKSLEAMGSFGRITSIADLPSIKVLTGYVKQAMKLNERNIKAPPKHKPAARKPPKTPPFFVAALKRSKKAFTTFDRLSPSHKREYIEWVTEAKREDTRAKRLATTIQWLANGKSRNWKYER